MTEYIVIVALVAIGTIGVVGLFGNNIRHLFGASSDSLAGNASVQSGAANRDSSLEGKNLTTFGMAGSGGTTTQTPNR
jgi:Flp pilus assembly pilin Flp